MDNHAPVPLSERVPDLWPLVPTPFSDPRTPPLPPILTSSSLISLVAVSSCCCFLCHQLDLPVFPESDHVFPPVPVPLVPLVFWLFTNLLVLQFQTCTSGVTVRSFIQ